MPGPSNIKIALIRTDGGTQPRAQLDGILIEEYAEIMRQGIYFPPIDAVYDGKDYWLWDGFHRVEAAQKAGKDSISANVKQGTRRDAVLYSVGANATHGLQRTNDDKRRSVMTLLEDEEWHLWSDHEIARRTSTSQTFVSKLRPLYLKTFSDQTSNDEPEPVRKFNRNGKTYEMGTSSIGKSNSRQEPSHDDENEQLLNELASEQASYDWTQDEPERPPTLPLQPKLQGSFRNVISVAEWQSMAKDERKAVIAEADRRTKYGWNETNDNVEWALWTWNPVTGCLHNCAYCYARDIAQRHYSHLDRLSDRFAPVFYPDRLYSPANAKHPDLSAIEDPVRRMGLRNVFVCSMADLFGKWVPAEWIEAVLQQAWDNPQWNFLFLTKFPIRMAEFEYPPNTWIGTTVDTQYAVERAEKAFRKVRASGYEGIAWLSCEPMMERLTFSSLEMFDWVVVGGASRSTQTPEFRPPFEWIVHLWNQAKALDLPVYMKTNLFLDDAHKGIDVPNRVREYPAKALK